jgi:hypothetical protein
MENTSSTRAVVYWLYTGMAMIVVQILLGGITRLTGSGLSITEWNVVTGALPPISDAQWLVEFEKYKGTPQYQLLNFDFKLYVKLLNQLNYLINSVFSLFSPEFAILLIESSISFTDIDTITVFNESERTNEGLKFLEVKILSFPKVMPTVSITLKSKGFRTF